MLNNNMDEQVPVTRQYVSRGEVIDEENELFSRLVFSELSERRRVNREQACILIQRKWRVHKRRMAIKQMGSPEGIKQQYAVLKVQRMWRGYATRKEYNEVRANMELPEFKIYKKTQKMAQEKLARGRVAADEYEERYLVYFMLSISQRRSPINHFIRMNPSVVFSRKMKTAYTLYTGKLLVLPRQKTCESELLHRTDIECEFEKLLPKFAISQQCIIRKSIEDIFEQSLFSLRESCNREILQSRIWKTFVSGFQDLRQFTISLQQEEWLCICRKETKLYKKMYVDHIVAAFDIGKHSTSTQESEEFYLLFGLFVFCTGYVKMSKLEIISRKQIAQESRGLHKSMCSDYYNILVQLREHHLRNKIEIMIGKDNQLQQLTSDYLIQKHITCTAECQQRISIFDSHSQQRLFVIESADRIHLCSIQNDSCRQLFDIYRVQKLMLSEWECRNNIKIEMICHTEYICRSLLNHIERQQTSFMMTMEIYEKAITVMFIEEQDYRNMVEKECDYTLEYINNIPTYMSNVVASHTQLKNEEECDRLTIIQSEEMFTKEAGKSLHHAAAEYDRQQRTDIEDLEISIRDGIDHSWKSIAQQAWAQTAVVCSGSFIRYCSRRNSVIAPVLDSHEQAKRTELQVVADLSLRMLHQQGHQDMRNAKTQQHIRRRIELINRKNYIAYIGKVVFGGEIEKRNQLLECEMQSFSVIQSEKEEFMETAKILLLPAIRSLDGVLDPFIMLLLGNENVAYYDHEEVFSRSNVSLLHQIENMFLSEPFSRSLLELEENQLYFQYRLHTQTRMLSTESDTVASKLYLDEEYSYSLIVINFEQELERFPIEEQSSFALYWLTIRATAVMTMQKFLRLYRANRKIRSVRRLVERKVLLSEISEQLDFKLSNLPNSESGGRTALEIEECVSYSTLSDKQKSHFMAAFPPIVSELESAINTTVINTVTHNKSSCFPELYKLFQYAPIVKEVNTSEQRCRARLHRHRKLDFRGILFDKTDGYARLPPLAKLPVVKDRDRRIKFKGNKPMAIIHRKKIIKKKSYEDHSTTIATAVKSERTRRQDIYKSEFLNRSELLIEWKVSLVSVCVGGSLPPLPAAHLPLIVCKRTFTPPAHRHPLIRSYSVSGDKIKINHVRLPEIVPLRL